MQHMGPTAMSPTDCPDLIEVDVMRFIVNNIEPKTVPVFMAGLGAIAESHDPNSATQLDRYLTEWVVSVRLLTDPSWRAAADADDVTEHAPRTMADVRQAGRHRRKRSSD